MTLFAQLDAPAAEISASAVGPLNNYWISTACHESCEIVCAWGCAQHAPQINARIAEVLAIFSTFFPRTPVTCLGYRQDGHPRHPLMLPYCTQLEPFIQRRLR